MKDRAEVSWGECSFASMGIFGAIQNFSSQCRQHCAYLCSSNRRCVGMQLKVMGLRTDLEMFSKMHRVHTVTVPQAEDL